MIRRIATVLFAGGLILGLVGGGVAASWVWNGSASQTINVGTLDIHISSTTGGAHVVDNTVICPDITIVNSAGFWAVPMASPVCNVTLTSVGTAPAKNASVFMTVTTNGASLSYYQVTASGAFAAVKTLDGPANTPLGVATAFPASINFTFDYGEFIKNDLPQADMGKTIQISFSISSSL